MQASEFKIPNGLFVLVKSKEDTLVRIDNLLTVVFRKLTNREAILTYKKFQHDVLGFLGDVFQPGTYGIEKLRGMVKGMISDDIEVVRRYGAKLFSLLFEIKTSLPYFITIDEMPSCRSLLEDPKEIAASKAKDLIKNNIVKVVANVVAIGKGVYDICNIADVHSYYKNVQRELEEERASGWELSLYEQILERKIETELEYCRLASLYVAGGLTKEALAAGQALVDEY